MLTDRHASESAITSLERNGKLNPTSHFTQQLGNKRLKVEPRTTGTACEMELTLTAKTRVPSFSLAKECRALLMVNWQEESNGECCDLSCVLGSVTINVVDLVKGTYESQERLFYEAACIKTKVTHYHCDFYSFVMDS